MYIVNLYNIRWERRYTQDEIVKATGLSKKTIGQMFSGKHYNYKIDTLEIVARFFKCKIQDILIEVNDK